MTMGKPGMGELLLGINYCQAKGGRHVAITLCEICAFYLKFTRSCLRGREPDDAACAGFVALREEYQERREP